MSRKTVREIQNYASKRGWRIAITRAMIEKRRLLLAYADLRDVILHGAYLRNANLTGANLTGAYLTGAYLTGANLTGANLTGANLYGADLTGAYLINANLEGANLINANLRGANLYGADLTGAYLRNANLTGAYLRNANLRDAYLRGADLINANLYGAYLTNCVMNWNSHDLIAECLRQAAGDNAQRRMVAGLILVSRDWCWDKFLALDIPEREWALDTLAGMVRDGDNAPAVLRERAALKQTEGTE